MFVCVISSLDISPHHGDTAFILCYFPLLKLRSAVAATWFLIILEDHKR